MLQCTTVPLTRQYKFKRLKHHPQYLGAHYDVPKPLRLSRYLDVVLSCYGTLYGTLCHAWRWCSAIHKTNYSFVRGMM